jgi:hypothetical protein
MEIWLVDSTGMTGILKESVGQGKDLNEFTNRMRSTLDEAKAALAKSKDDMAQYYNQRHTPAPDFQPGDKVYLEATDITTTRPSRKLSHKHTVFQITY